MKLSPREKNKINKLFDSGKTIREIKEACSASKKNIYKAIVEEKFSIIESNCFSFEEIMILKENILDDIEEKDYIKEKDRAEEIRIMTFNKFRKDKLYKNKKIISREIRDWELVKLYKIGKTFEEIGEQYGFSRQRAHQIFSNQVKKEIIGRVDLYNKELNNEEKKMLEIIAKEEIKEIFNKRRKIKNKKK